jgi:hypothetical protein
MANWKRRITKELLLSLFVIILVGLVGYVLMLTTYWVEHKKYTEKMVQLVRDKLGKWNPEEVTPKTYPEIKALQKWSKDPEFKKLPASEKIRRYTNYFNQKLADKEFFQFSPEEQTRIRNNFFKANIPDLTSEIIGTFKRAFPKYSAWSNEDLEERLPELDYREFPFLPLSISEKGLFFPIYLAIFSYLLFLFMRSIICSIKQVRSKASEA